MKIDTVVNCDSIEIFIKGEKVSLLAEMKVYHWEIMREYGINITDLLRVAFAKERY